MTYCAIMVFLIFINLKFFTMSTVNWNLIYGTGASLNQGIPMSANTDLDNCIFRDLQINLNALQNQAGVSGLPMCQIFCDTLQIDNDIVVDGALFIYARRIVAPIGTTIALSRVDSNYTPFSVLAQETVDINGNPSNLVIQTVQDVATTATASFTANGVENGLIWNMGSNLSSPYLPQDVSLSAFCYGQPLQLSLMSLFSLASLVFTTDINVAIRQLQWVSNLGKFGTDTLDLAAQASTLASTLQAMSALPQGDILVPALDETVYETKAKACLLYLQNQQSSYTALQQEESNLTQWLADAKTHLQVSGVEQTLYSNLEQQSQTTLNQTQYARMVAGQEIVADNNTLVGLQIKFNRGVKDWESSQQTKAALDIVTGSVEILAQLPAIIVAGPEIEALPAIQTASSLLSKVTDAMGSMLSSTPSTSSNTNSSSESDSESTAGSDSVNGSFSGSTTSDPAMDEKRQKMQDKLVSAAKAIGSGATGIVDSAMKIYDVTRTASALKSAGQNALNLANNTVSTAFKSMNVTGLNLITGGYQDWDCLSADIDSIFTTINGYGIFGASEYQLGINKLIIAGKAYCQTQVAVAKAMTELAEAKMRQIAASQKVTIFDQRYQFVQNEITKDQAAGQLLYVKVFDAKRAVYLALESYLRAVEYFTLKPASSLPPMPLMTADVNDFAAAISLIAGNQLVLSALNPPPQTMGTYNNPGPAITLNSPRLLSQLVDTSFGSWYIKKDDPAFQGFFRIRLRTVRIYLMGVTSSENIEVQIVTSGAYSDINPNVLPKQFVGTPMRINFVYSGNPSNPNIIFDGTVPTRYANDFFQPTPFTSWAIKVSAQNGQHIDLSGITGVQIHFGGEATPIQ